MVGSSTPFRDPTPLPWRQVMILLVVRLADPLSFTILFPFVYFMVKGFNLTDDDGKVGYYVGFIASSFAVAQMFSGIPWGILSDRIGRRPVILTGMAGTSISLFMFGLSKSLPWAIVTRSMCGLLSGNVGVIKSAMAELTDSTNRAQGFSLMPMVFGFGTVLGPTLGGFLSNPATKYPNVFGKGEIGRFFLEYPYILPCGICSIIVAASGIFGFFFLEETIDKNQESISSSPTSYTRLASSPDTLSSTSFFDEVSFKSWLAISCFAGQSFQSVIQSELTPLWAATPIILGGLSFDSSDIGSLMAFGGISLLLIQIFLYVPVQRRISTLLLYRLAFLSFSGVILLFPVVSFFTSPDLRWLLWPSLLFLTAIRTGCNVFAVTSINLLLVETCPSKRVLGKINGISQTAGAAMRAIGPTFCGMVYSWSLTNDYSFPLFKAPFTWIVLSTIALFNFFLTFRLSEQPSEEF